MENEKGKICFLAWSRKLEPAGAGGDGGEGGGDEAVCEGVMAITILGVDNNSIGQNNGSG